MRLRAVLDGIAVASRDAPPASTQQPDGRSDGHQRGDTSNGASNGRTASKEGMSELRLWTDAGWATDPTTDLLDAPADAEEDVPAGAEALTPASAAEDDRACPASEDADAAANPGQRTSLTSERRRRRPISKQASHACNDRRTGHGVVHCRGVAVQGDIVWKDADDAVQTLSRAGVSEAGSVSGPVARFGGC